MSPVKVTQGSPRDSYAHTCTHTHSHLDGGESEREWQMLIFCFTCVWVGRTYLVRHEWRVTWLWVTAKCLLTSYRQCGLSLPPSFFLWKNAIMFLSVETQRHLLPLSTYPHNLSTSHSCALSFLHTVKLYARSLCNLRVAWRTVWLATDDLMFGLRQPFFLE